MNEDICTNLPISFQVAGQTEADSDRHSVLKLNKNLYGIKQGSFNWYKKLNTSLVNHNFKPFDIDPFQYIGNGMIVLTYVDDYIIVGPSLQNIYTFVKSMEVGPNFVFADQ